MKKTILLLIILLSAITSPAFAYIDPGSGGYLFNSILAMLGGFFAIAFTFIAAIFRNTVGRAVKFLWSQYRIPTIILACALIIGTAALLYKAFYEPSMTKFDPKLSGAHIYDRAIVSPGYNLYEGKLVDIEGRLIKKWSSLSLGVIDANGDYYGQKYFESPTWGRYSWDDKTIWEMELPIHHEIILTPQDTIITFTKEVHEYQGRKVEFDVILELSKAGKILSRFSFWDHLKEFQQYHRKLELDMSPTFLIPEDHKKDKSVWGGNYDYYHLNSLTIIPDNALKKAHPAFTPGNWLISFRHGSMVFILDKDTKKVLWRAIYDQVPDRLEGPHAPTMLPEGKILLFDNGRYRKWSRIILLDPVTLKVVWEYRDKGFYTLSQGYVQELSGGNMLVTEAECGRAFELTPEKNIVWEYYNPDKQNSTNSNDKKRWGSRQEIYRMTRYPAEMIDNLLKQ